VPHEAALESRGLSTFSGKAAIEVSMSRTIWGGIVILAALVMLPMHAEAQPIISIRCTVDNLDTNAKAEARADWARRCGQRQNVGVNTAWYDTGLASASGGTLKDYLEADLVRNPKGEMAYSGPDYLYKLNNTFVWAVYLSGPTYQDNKEEGWYRWWRDSWRKKGRALYPTFGTTSNINDPDNDQLFPHPTLATCGLYTDQNGQNPATVPFYVNGYCESACYTPEQKLLFSDGEVSILDALDARREDLMTLTSDSTLEDVKLQQNRTYSYTKESRDAQHNIYVITTRSGGELRVTHEHPVINGEGRMVQAQTLKVGDALVRVDGSMDPIVDIQKTTHFGKVYNISPVTTDLVSNVLVAQGFLVGSVRFQNDEVEQINRVILYRGMPVELIP
jgi:hypothetical protein